MELKDTWARMPSKWIQFDYGLKKFTWSDKADSIAALMLYIAISLRANHKPNDEFESPGYAKISYTMLEIMTGISRSMVTRGLNKLQSLELINIHKDGNKNVYQLTRYDPTRGWAKLPKRYLFGSSVTDREPIEKGVIIPFKNFTLRHKNELNALKLYLALITFRPNDSHEAFLTYEKIAQYTGIQSRDIRPAMFFLINIMLIYVTSEHDSESKKNLPNRYTIRGLGHRDGLLKKPDSSVDS